MPRAARGRMDLGALLEALEHSSLAERDEAFALALPDRRDRPHRRASRCSSAPWWRSISRLLGFARSTSIRALERSLLPWSWVALLLIVPSGVAMFSTHAVDFAGNPAFRVKLLLLLGAGLNALLFHNGVFRYGRRVGPAQPTPRAAKASAAALARDLDRGHFVRPADRLPVSCRRSPTYNVGHAPAVLLSRPPSRSSPPAPRPRIVEQWQAPASAAGPFKRLLVVGVTKEATVRRIFEDEFVRQLRARGTDAVASYTLIPEDGQVDRPRLERAVKESRADGGRHHARPPGREEDPGRAGNAGVPRLRHRHLRSLRHRVGRRLDRLRVAAGGVPVRRGEGGDEALPGRQTPRWSGPRRATCSRRPTPARTAPTSRRGSSPRSLPRKLI